MRIAFLLIVLGVALAEAAALKGEAFPDDNKLETSADFIKNVQGATHDLFFIVFEKDGNTYSDKLITALDPATNNGQLPDTYDMFNAAYEPAADKAFKVLVGQIDARDQTKWKDALDLIGANDDKFSMTYPLMLIMRDGKGELASMKNYVEQVDNADASAKVDGLAAPILKKYIELTGAKKT